MISPQRILAHKGLSNNYCYRLSRGKCRNIRHSHWQTNQGRKNCSQHAAEQELQERARTTGTDLKNTASVSGCGAQRSQQWPSAATSAYSLEYRSRHPLTLCSLVLRDHLFISASKILRWYALKISFLYRCVFTMNVYIWKKGKAEKTHYNKFIHVWLNHFPANYHPNILSHGFRNAWWSLILINYSKSLIILDLSCTESLLSLLPSGSLSTALFLGQCNFKDASVRYSCIKKLYLVHRLIYGK